MSKARRNGFRLPLSWALGASLTLLPLTMVPGALAQNDAANGQQGTQDTTQQTPDWSHAAPPQDAQDNQNDQAPAQDAQPSDDGQDAQAQPAQPANQPGQQGDWGPAGPPPDAQNGQVPAPAPQDQGGPQEGGPQVGYGQPGQPARPPYQPNQSYQNQPNQPYQDQPNQPYQDQQYPNQAQSAPLPPVTVGAGTLVRIRTNEPLDTKRLQAGNFFSGTIAENVFVGNVLAIPRGAQVTGRVVDVKKPGDLKGSAGMALELTNLNLEGRAYSLASDTWWSNGPGKGAYTAGNTVGTAALGAVLGAIAGGGPGAAIGAAAGTGVGLGASAATPGPRAVIPPEALLTFHLTAPVTVQPISYQEAQRLEAQSAPEDRYAPRPGYPGGNYYYRGYPPPPPPAYYPYPYAYAYPYPYVRAYGYPRYYYRYWRR